MGSIHCNALLGKGQNHCHIWFNSTVECVSSLEDQAPIACMSSVTTRIPTSEAA